ncbi:MAG: pyridoxamine 5'-phosphate oxidase family protein [Bacteroidota bacterium]
MAKQYDQISPELQAFIEAQKIFFVATARREGRINLSPKGMEDTLRVLDARRVCWINLTGSGNETAAHLLESKRMTLMFCAFEGKPLILRLYGAATAYHERDPEYQQYIGHFPSIAGTRQVVLMEVDLVQTSCGFAVPLMEYREDRQILRDWAEKKGEDNIRAYWREKNTRSLDGHPTRIIE